MAKRAAMVKYTDAIGEEICRRIADGESLRSICRDKHMPELATVHRWTGDSSHPLCDQYARARDKQADYFAGRVAEVADDTLNGKYDPQAARVAVDAFKWTAARMAPKRWGDRQHHEHTGEMKTVFIDGESFKAAAGDDT